MEQSSSPNLFFRKAAHYKLWAVLLIIVLVASGFWLYGQLTPPAADLVLDEGYSAYLAGNYEDAIQIYEKGLQNNPDNLGILVELIKTYAMMGNRTGAIAEAVAQAKQYADSALALAPDNYDVLVALGYLAETDGHYEEAAQYYLQAINIFSDFPNAWFSLGRAYGLLGEFALSQDAYDKAYELDPTHPLILMQRAGVLASNNNTEEAFELFLTVTATSPQIPLKAEAFASAASISRQRGAYDEARDLARLAVMMDRSYIPGLVEYAMSLLWDGDYPSSLAYLDEAIIRRPDMAQPYWTRGIVFRTIGVFDESISAFEQAMQHIDNDDTLVGSEAKQKVRSEITYDLAKAYSMSANTTQALPLLEEAIELNQDLSIYLDDDFKNNGFFGELADNAGFLALLP